MFIWGFGESHWIIQSLEKYHQFIILVLDIFLGFWRMIKYISCQKILLYILIKLINLIVYTVKLF